MISNIMIMSTMYSNKINCVECPEVMDMYIVSFQELTGAGTCSVSRAVTKTSSYRV